MLFPTLTFAIFFALVYPISWWLRPRDRPWKLFILAASYVFYGYWDWRFVFLIILSSGVNWVLGQRIALATGSTERRGWLTLAVGYNLAVLGVFKYYGFFIESANSALRTFGATSRLPFLEIILPVGISFFTFQALSYVIDLHRRQITPVSLLDFSVYLAFFPHLVAGPIVRAREFLPQIPQKHRLTHEEASRAALMIGRGAFKKVVISSYLSTTIVDPVFAVPGQYSAPEIIVAIYAYAIQIYADFSGYTDMAIGLALLLGFKFPQNFDRPYISRNIQEFWRRWHMTLSRWLRDYLYIPLGGNRKGELRTYVNLLITMTLGGLWHGAGGHFVLWGVYQGVGLSAHRAYDRRRTAHLASQPAPADGPAAAPPMWWRSALSWLITFNFVCLGWVLFRAPTLGDALGMLARAATAWGPAPAVSVGVVVVIVGMLASQFVPPDWGHRFEGHFARLPLPLQGVALGAFMALVAALGPKGIAPFIYFQF